jgi:outer membrane protein, multidrug efflux system
LRRDVYLASVAGLASGLLLSGCKVGPDYHRPTVVVPKAFQYEPVEVAATANVDWWTQFNDPVLNQLIVDGLANNKSIKIAAANVEQAGAVLTSTRSPLFPQLNYQAAAGRYRFSQNTTTALPGNLSNPTNAYQVLAGASWELDLWGRIRRLTEAAQANLLATEEARRGVILSLVASVASDYLNLRGLDEQLAMAERTLKSYSGSLQLMEFRFEHGRVSEMNVDQARARYETAAAQIPQIKSEIAVLENALSILLGRNPGTIPRGKPIFELALPAIPAGVPSELLERRPDLLQSEQQLIAANAQIGAAKAQFFPTISLTGARGYSSTDLSQLFKGPAHQWSYGGGFAGPIFTGGAVYGQFKQAKAAQKAALIGYQAAIQSAFADVDNALVSQQELSEQVAAQERLVTALRGYAQLSQYLFDGGREPYSTVLQAQEDLFPAELNWAAARASLCITFVDIYKAMGGGWIDDAAKLTAGVPAITTRSGVAKTQASGK